MHNIFDISYLIVNYGYLGVFLVVFLESGIFFALPGDSLLFSAGILASAGVISLFTIIPIIFIATFFGSIAGYYIGTHLKKLQKYHFFNRFIKQEHLSKAHIFFEKHGKSAMIFSRFIPIIRTFVPIVAGIAKMDQKFFIMWNLIGSMLWTLVVTLLGYYLGVIFPEIIGYSHYFLILVIIISLIPLFWKTAKKHLMKFQTK